MSNPAKTIYPSSMASVSGFQIPKSLDALNKYFMTAAFKDEEAKLSPLKSIHDLTQEYLGSGSRVTQIQYLAMRVVQEKTETRPNKLVCRLEEFGLDSVWGNAFRIVNLSAAFQAYVKLIRAGSSIISVDPAYCSSFTSVKLLQEQTTRVIPNPIKRLSSKSIRSSSTLVPSSSHRNPPLRVTKPQERTGKALLSQRKRAAAAAAKEKILAQAQDADEQHDLLESPDEATPNAAVVSLVQMLTHLVKDSGMEWSHDHAHFHAKFGNASFEAWTDGSFRPILRDSISAIVEAKKRSRRLRKDSIIMQEAAEVVAWLLNGKNRMPDLNGHRILVSQNNDEIWVTFATCHDDYVDEYLEKDTITSDTHLTMKTLGPFGINSGDDMEVFAMLIVAVTLKI